MRDISKNSVLFPVAFLSVVGLGCTTFGISFYVKDILGAGPSAVGQFTGIWSAFYIVGCLVLQPLGRRISPLWSLLIALCSMAFFMGLVLFARTIPLALLFFGLYGFATSLLFPPLIAWVTAGVEKEALGRLTSRFAVSWSLGGIIAPWAGSRLLNIDRHIPLFFSIGVYLLIGAVLLAANALVPNIRGDSSEKSVESVVAGIDSSTLLRFPAWILLFTSYVMNGLIMSQWPVYLRDVAAIPTASIGTIYLVRSATMTFVFILLGRFVLWHFKRRMFFVTSGLVMATATALLVFRSEAALTVILAVNAFATGLAYNGAIFYASAGAVNRRKRMAINESILNAGAVMGAVGGGIMLEFTSMNTVIVCIIALMTIGVIAQARLLVGSTRESA
ncbi:MAG: MFS transporter [Treponemataceae bacterium]